MASEVSQFSWKWHLYGCYVLYFGLHFLLMFFDWQKLSFVNIGQKRLKAAEAESKLKQVYIPT